MSRRITITLTDEEYALLEQRAAQDRRSPREMAAYLVSRGEQWRLVPSVPNTFPLMPWQNPVISSGSTGNLSFCPACTNPDTNGVHTCARFLTVCTTTAS